MNDSINNVDPAFKLVPKNATAFLIWRVENLAIVPVPKDQYGTFFEGDSYIIYAASAPGQFVGPGIKSVDVAGPLETHIHFWLGEATSQDESAVAAYKTVELDDYLAGSPVQHREVQGSESPRFKSYFANGIRLLKGGVSSGLYHVTATFEPRLFRVKGRRTPLVRQMPAIDWAHFNHGDVFIIDTSDVIFVWIGSHANSMEKLLATKVAVQLRDEHHAVSIVFVDDGAETQLPDSERLLLGVYLDLSAAARSRVARAVAAGDDCGSERFARAALRLYRCSDEDGTYKVVEIKSGPLYHSDLNSNDSFIIDNGALGIWVWVGRKASPKERVEAMRNATGFVKKKQYPNHTPVSRVVEHAEPTEFKALFLNWQDKDTPAKPLFNRTNSVNNNKPKPVATKLDAASLHATPSLAAETQLVDDGSGQLQVWRVHQSQLVATPPSQHGVFYGGDCYLVHYTYSAVSRQSHVLYYWLGLHSSVTEQTALALHTVAEDEKLAGVATQVRVVQGKEPPHFLAIFKGRMITLLGDHSDTFPAKYLLQVQGNRMHNARAVQVPFRMSSLNSNDVFVMVNGSSCYIWCGKGSTGDEREMAKSVALKISGPEFVVVYEGQEKEDFWSTIGNKEPYANDKRLAEPSNPVPARLFHCSNASGSFKVEEVLNFHQIDLVPEDVMLLDAWNSIFIWVGYKSNKEERTGAIQLAFDYLRTDPNGRDEKTPIIQLKQGHEPPNFTGFFGSWDSELWKSDKTFEEVRQELEGQKPVLQVELKMTNGVHDFDECKKYPIQDLLPKDPEKLPDGVDPLHKELHLSHPDFVTAFGMKYEDFAQLPKWRQENLKKAAGLF
ncbi:villin-1 isoform X2 [Nilaparvata lugens]|nr:villin-1 isoform X2 [Nilaparvata lugens]